jgi:hypothetical protein
MEFTVTSFPTDLIGPPSITNSSFGGLDADMAFSGASLTVLSSSALACSLGGVSAGACCSLPFDCLVDCLVDAMVVLAYGLDPMDALRELATVALVQDRLLLDEFLLPAMTRV